MDPYNSADEKTLSTSSVNPYAAPDARIADVAHGDIQAKSSRGARLGAVLLDSLPIIVLAIVMAIALPATQRAGNDGISTTGTVILIGMGLAVLVFGVYQLVMLHRHGQTLGKKLVGIKIVRNDGSRAGLGRICWLRYFVPGIIGAIPIVGPVFGLVDPLFIFGEEKRCLHDLIADTIVVDA